MNGILQDSPNCCHVFNYALVSHLTGVGAGNVIIKLRLLFSIKFRINFVTLGVKFMTTSHGFAVVRYVGY